MAFRLLQGRNVPQFVNELLLFLTIVGLTAVLVATLGVLAQITAGAVGVDVGWRPEERHAAIRDLAFVLVGVGAAAFAYWRGRIATWQAATVEQGLFNDRFTKGVEQLGAERAARLLARSITYRVTAGGRTDIVELLELEDEPVSLPPDVPEEMVERGPWFSREDTRPNVEVRIGSIYALEQLALDSRHDRLLVLETLCAYIRENAWAYDGDGAAPLRGDVRVALEVLARDILRQGRGRRSSVYRPQLEGADFRRRIVNRVPLDDMQLEAADFEGAYLKGAMLERAVLHRASLAHARAGEARLTGADLSQALLRQADLAGALLTDADATRADLARARLTGADLSGALLTEARLDGADLSAARLAGANLSWARLERAVLARAVLDDAELTWAELAGASLGGASMVGAALRFVDLREVKDATAPMVAAAFGDASVILPDGWPWPPHWPRAVLTNAAFHGRWRGWRQSRGLVWPPPGAAQRTLADVALTPPGQPIAASETE
ncbi:MAG: pentapeptide repeat-containing protein [Pseudomonadota bacterium]